jgi:hypothetical protein
MAGLMEGYLGGLQYLSGLQDMDQKKQAFDLDYQQRVDAANENRQSKDILAQVFKKSAADLSVTDSLTSQSRLADKFQEAGTQVLSSNPKSGMELIKQASDLRARVQNAAIEQAQAGVLQDKLLAGRAAQVYDQESLDGYVKDLAKAGRVIPQKYQVWSPETESWMKKQEMLGVTAYQQKQLELSTAREKNQERLADIRAEAEKQKTIYENSKEARLRDRQVSQERIAGIKSANVFKLRGDKDRAVEVGALESMDTEGLFKKADPGIKNSAADDVRFRATKIYADSLTNLDPDNQLSQEDALRLARESVLGEMKKDGSSWNPFAGVTRDAGSKEPKAPVGGRAQVGEASPEVGIGKPVGKSAISPLPQSKDALVSGQIYNTARGPALWKGDHFESLK